MPTTATVHPSKKDLALVVLITAFAYLIFRGLDPKEMLSGNVHPWDSWHYLGLSNQMIENGIFNLSELRPFCYRLVQPALATLLRLASSYSYSEASHAINAFCALITSIFCFSLWRSLGLSRIFSYSGILLISISWLGPLRYSIYYPGGQFAFEILMTCVSFWSIKKIYLSSSAKGFAVPALSLLVATLGRENILYLAIITAICLWAHDRIGHNRIDLTPHFISLGSVLLGYIITRLLVEGEGSYSVFSTILAFGWFHLNIGESLYMYFYSFGPLTLATLLCISFARPRKTLFKILNPNKSLDNRLILAFCLASFIFAFVGGTDSDRFLLWSFPFYFYIGLSSLSVLFDSIPAGRSGTVIFATLFLSAVLWSRFYVPAIPHLLFTDKFDSHAGVRTNLNPALYKGPSLMLRLRKDLVELPITDAFNSERIGSVQAFPRAFVAENVANAQYSRDNDQALNTPVSKFKDSYRFGINNIPFPLGFAHNQNELLAIHPYHGGHRLRMLLLGQWIILYLVLAGLISMNMAGKIKQAGAPVSSNVST
jgi:hypothetical protein